MLVIVEALSEGSGIISSADSCLCHIAHQPHLQSRGSTMSYIHSSQRILSTITDNNEAEAFAVALALRIAL